MFFFSTPLLYPFFTPSKLSPTPVLPVRSLPPSLSNTLNITLIHPNSHTQMHIHTHTHTHAHTNDHNYDDNYNDNNDADNYDFFLIVMVMMRKLKTFDCCACTCFTYQVRGFRYPRINRESLLPIPTSFGPESADG